MTNASTADGHGQDRPPDAEPFFPSEGSFSTVVPLSEIGHAPVPPAGAADAGKPAEADWARAAARAGRAGGKEEEETTLVPARAGNAHVAAREARANGVRQSWGVTAAALVLSVAAGVASGAYLVWSSQRAPEVRHATSPTGREAAKEEAAAGQAPVEAPRTEPAPANAATHAPEAAEGGANAKAEKLNEVAKDEKVNEVARTEKLNEVSHAPKQVPPAEPPSRTRSEAREMTPAPKLRPGQSAASERTRVTPAAKQPPTPSPSGRTLPVSSPPPSARSRKVIQWP